MTDAMAAAEQSTKRTLWRFLPFWAFLALFKFAATLHYSLLSPLGERLLPLWVVGLMVGVGSFLQLVFDVPVGRLLDRYGYVKFLKVTTFAFALAGVAWMFDFRVLTYGISFVLSTIGWQFFGPGVNAYVLSQAPKGKAGSFISHRDVYESLGVVVASSVLGFTLTLKVPAMGWIVAAGMLLGFCALFFAPRDRGPVQDRRVMETQEYVVGRHRLGSVLAAMRRLNPASFLLVLTGFVASTFYGIVWFVVPLVIAHEAQTGVLSLGLGIFDFSIVVLGFLLGRLADRGNRRALVFFGLLLFSVAGALVGFNFGWLFLLFGFLATAGDEMSSISLWSWLHALDRTHAADGLVAGAINVSDDLGWAVGPALAGILYGLIGPSWTIASGAVLLFCAWIAYQFMMRHHRHAPVLDLPPKPHRRRHKG